MIETMNKAFSLLPGMLLLVACTTFDRDGFGEDGPCEWDPIFFYPCAHELPPSPAALTGGTYFIDTSADEPVLETDLGSPVLTDEVTVSIVAQPSGPEAVLMLFRGLTVEGDVELRAWSQVDGPERPLILASWTDMEIFGIIDVSSDSSADAFSLGAGGNSAECMSSNGETGVDLSGGGGGGFGASGGGGGRVDFGLPASGGSAVDVPSRFARGGCRGGHGTDAFGTRSGVAGHGGGAVIFATQSNLVFGSGAIINAGGGGGGGALGAQSSGGGGGSGGYIGLLAPFVTVQSGVVIAANGGGGGGGMDANPTMTAQSGDDGQPTEASASGGLGAGGADGGNGGSHLFGIGEPGIAVSVGGSGGGGGGVGFIVAASELGLTIDPSAQLSPGIAVLP